MSKAIISDIHGNLPALEAVLQDIDDNLDVDEIICLGDVVGYNLQPYECVQLLRERKIPIIMGNHDHAIVDPKERAGRFVKRAKHIIQVHHNILREKEGVLEFLDRLPLTRKDGKILYVHASPAKPLDEYVPDEWFNRNRRGWELKRDDHGYVCDISFIHMIYEGVWSAFVGHSHDPCVFDFFGHQGQPQLIRASQAGYRFFLNPEKRYVINVGSVGQPRERKPCRFGMLEPAGPAACYVHLDGNVIEWRKVDYDFRKTQRIIKQFVTGNKKEEDHLLYWEHAIERLEIGC